MAKKKNRPPADLRARINVAALIEALEQHVLGEKEMTATPVTLTTGGPIAMLALKGNMHQLPVANA